MALCASEVMEGAVAALNRLPLSLVSSEWVEQVELNQTQIKRLKLNLYSLDHSTLPPGQVVLKFEPPKTQVGQ